MYGYTPNQQENPNDFGSRFVERFEANQYNQAVQRNDPYLAGQAFARIIGFFFSRRAAG